MYLNCVSVSSTYEFAKHIEFYKSTFKNCLFEIVIELLREEFLDICYPNNTPSKQWGKRNLFLSRRKSSVYQTVLNGEQCLVYYFYIAQKQTEIGNLQEDKIDLKLDNF